MSEEFSIINVIYEQDSLEELGTKEKFWYTDGNGDRYLFKKSRDLTGEHWAEKIAEEICKLLDIPHAHYDLAKYNGFDGVVSKDILHDSELDMILGNELLTSVDNAYPNTPENQFIRVKEHTLDLVLSALEGISPPIWPGLTGKTDMDAADVFIGYLMLDTLISNQDRHHENWAILKDRSSGDEFLCPSYDHASSLGCTERDEKRKNRLESNDKGYKVETFVEKAKGALYQSKGSKKPLKLREAFTLAADTREKAAQFWLQKLNQVTEDKFNSLLNRVPNGIISTTAKQFAMKMIAENRKYLLCKLQ